MSLMMVDPYRSAAAVVTGANALFQAVNTTSNSTTSATNVDVTISGTAVTISFTKASGATDILVSAGMSILNSNASTPSVALAVNDGATDWDLMLLGSASNSNNNQSQLVGYRLLTGLAAGAKTLTLRMHSNGTVSISCSAGGSLYLRAIEVDST